MIISVNLDDHTYRLLKELAYAYETTEEKAAEHALISFLKDARDFGFKNIRVMNPDDLPIASEEERAAFLEMLKKS